MVKRPKPAMRWKTVKFLAKDVSGWISFKSHVDLKSDHHGLMSSKAVYIVRIRRPWAFYYKKKPSPVAYIGEGNAQQRISSHLRSWISTLAKEIPELKIEIAYATPTLRGRGKTSERVEADLLEQFERIHGALPLRNRQRELKNRGNYRYNRVTKGYLQMGKGRGFKFTLSPLRSPGLYEVSRKRLKQK